MLIVVNILHSFILIFQAIQKSLCHFNTPCSYSTPAQVIRDDKCTVQPICREELSEYVSSQIKTYLIITLLLPFAAITLFSLILRKYIRKINTTLAQLANHHNYWVDLYWDHINDVCDFHGYSYMLFIMLPQIMNTKILHYLLN